MFIVKNMALGSPMTANACELCLQMVPDLRDFSISWWCESYTRSIETGLRILNLDVVLGKWDALWYFLTMQQAAAPHWSHSQEHL